MPRFPGFIGGSGVRQSLISDAEDTSNFYVERISEDAAALFPTPGFTPWSVVADVGGRASLYANGRYFVVMGAGFYEYDVNGTATKRGTVAVDQNPAQIIFNGVVGGQLGISAGGNVYCFTLATNAFAQVLTGAGTMIAYVGGFGLAFNGNTGVVRLSNPNDLSTWPPGVFYQRSLFADPWQAMFVDPQNLIWMIGTDTFEVWNNTGVGTQPFAPLSGLVGRWGIAAPFAWAVSSLGAVWLGRNPDGMGQFVMTRNGSPTPIGGYAVNTAVAGYLRTSRIDDAELMVYEQEGHTFAVAAFPSVPVTWALDLNGESVAKRGRWNPAAGRFDLWAPRVHTIAFGKHLVADRSTGRIWTMDTNVATDIDGAGIRRVRRAPGLIDEHKRHPIDQFEVLCDVGLGLPSGQGSDPRLMLRVSVDGGRTWGNERQASIGRLGEYRQRAYWTRIGAPPHAVFEVSSSEPIPIRLTDAYLNNQEKAA